MSVQSSPLADQFAGLRAAITSNDDRGWLPAALDALITACLLRLFGRLEQLLRLWQTAGLPPPPIRSAAPGIASRDSSCGLRRSAPRTSRRHSHRREPDTLTAERRWRIRTAIPRAFPAMCAHDRASTSAVIAPCVRPRQARAPPPAWQPICCETPYGGPHNCA